MPQFLFLCPKIFLRVRTWSDFARYTFDYAYPIALKGLNFVWIIGKQPYLSYA